MTITQATPSDTKRNLTPITDAILPFVQTMLNLAYEYRGQGSSFVTITDFMWDRKVYQATVVAGVSEERGKYTITVSFAAAVDRDDASVFTNYYNDIHQAIVSRLKSKATDESGWTIHEGFEPHNTSIVCTAVRLQARS